MVFYMCTFGRNAEKHEYPRIIVWEKFVPWDLILRTSDRSISNPRNTGNKTLESVLAEFQPSRYPLRNIDALELDLGKIERTH